MNDPTVCRAPTAAPAHLETAEVARSRDDHHLDRIDVLPLIASRVESPAAGSLLDLLV